MSAFVAADAPTPSSAGFVQPQQYVESTGPRGGLPLPSSAYPDFRYRFHPLRWDFFWDAEARTGEWLPVLKRAFIDPGVDNVDKDRSTVLGEALAIQDGWRTLPVEVVPGRPYISVYDSLDGGKVHLTRWERPKRPGAGNQVMIVVDEAGYREWLRALVATGAVPAADPDVLAVKRSLLEREYDKDQGEAPTDFKARARAERTKAMLAAMDAAQGDRTGARGRAGSKPGLPRGAEAGV